MSAPNPPDTFLGFQEVAVNKAQVPAIMKLHSSEKIGKIHQDI